MFFDTVLLNIQHGGRFGIAWIAATRGLRFITKKQLKELNILKLCDELKLFIISYSSSPKKRFSLRLSAILVNGVVKIFKEQTANLQGESFSILSSYHMPAEISSISDGRDTGMFETPPTPIPKTKRKRARKEITETPDVKLDEIFKFPNIEDILQPTARADEISIREEMPKQKEQLEDDFGLGVLSRQELNEEMLLLAKSQEFPTVQPQTPSSDLLVPQGLIEVVAQVHAPKDKEVIEHPQVMTEEPLPVTESLPVAVPEPNQVTELISVIEPVPIVQPEISKEPAVQTETEPAIAEQTVGTVEVVKAAKTKKGDRKQLTELQIDEIPRKTTKVSEKKEKLLVRPLKYRFVRINRCNEFEGQFTDETYPSPIPFTSTPTVNENLFNLFWMESDEENIQIRGVSSLKSLSLGDSANLRGTDTISARPSALESISETGIRPSVQSLETPEMQPVLRESKVDTELKQISIEEPVVPTLTPKKRKRTTKHVEQAVLEQPTELPEIVPESIPVPEQITVTEQVAIPETTVESEVRLSQEAVSVPREFIPTTSKIPGIETPSSDYKLRQQRIINIVSKWSSSAMITIEDVCEIPINRLNIARAFSDVLTLAANKFLILKSHAESIQLKYIEKGPKLMN